MQFNSWKKLTSNEKLMIGFALILLTAIIFKWNPIWEGIKKGFKPYHYEQPAK